MILPIGHQESSVRRLPWVSFAIIVSCFAVLLMTDMSKVKPEPSPEWRMHVAADYWRQHAYLEVEPEVITVVAYDVMPNQRTQYIELLKSSGRDTAPEDDVLIATQQAELDHLTDLALGRAEPTETEANERGPFRQWGYIPKEGRPLTLLTHIFMHAGWLHLLSNMFMFFLAGPPVEDRLGRPLFAAVYLGSGVFAALFWGGLVDQKMIPLVGASGAIAGILGAFCIRFWKSDIRFFYFFFFGLRPVFGTFEAKAWLMLPLWFANEIFQAWLASSLGVSDGVAYWAHVGGFAFGAGAMALVKSLRIEERYIHTAIEQKVTLVAGNPVVEEAAELRDAGNHEAALDLLKKAFAEHPEDRDVALSLWDAAVAVGRQIEGAEGARAAVRLASIDDSKQLAIQYWMDLSAALPGCLVDAPSLMRLATALEAEGDRELAVRALREALDPASAGLTTGLAVKAVGMGEQIDPPSQLRAARRVMASADLHEAKRERFARMVEALESEGVEEPPTVEAQAAERESEKHRDRAIELSDDPAPGPMAGVALAMAPPPLPLGPPPIPQPLADTPPPLSPPPPPLPRPFIADDVEIGVDPELAAEEESLFGEMEDLVSSVRFSGTKVVEAVPTGVEDGFFRMMVSPDRKAKLAYDKIEALSVAAVKGLGPKTVLLVDLLLNWTALDDEQLHVIRLRSNAFDPRRMVSGAGSPMEALQAFVRELVERSGAVCLPSRDFLGGDFESFESLQIYERQVLMVDA